MSSSASLVSSVPQTGDPVVTATDVSVATTTYIGPQTIMEGDNQQTAFNLLLGQIDYATLVTFDVYQTITTTTTDTYLTTEKYELVGVAPATHFTVTAPATATAGAAFNVTALDQFNNTATGYTGTVRFTSSYGAAVLPANATLTNGVGTFPATLNTPVTRTITATDMVTASITGTSGNIAVSATYSVTYNGNTNTGGTVPVDGNAHAAGALVTVLGNTGSLVKTGYTFAGWNTAANGSGAGYAGGATFAMGPASVTLYAQWSLIPTGTVPSITSANSATFTVGVHGTFAVTATGAPTPALTETGVLPGGVTFIDNGNGSATLGGTPATATNGVYHITFTTHNSTGPDATQSFTLTVLESEPVLNVSTLSDGSVITGVVNNGSGSAATPWPWTAVNGLYSGVILNVSGFATSPDGIQSVTYNGTALSLAADGSFSFPALLAPGPNTITVVAIDKTGRKATPAAPSPFPVQDPLWL